MFEHLAFDRHVIRLRLTEPVDFAHFLHGGVIHGLLAAVFEKRRISHRIFPSAPESGRIRFEAGDPYGFGLTLVGEARGEIDRIGRRLRAIGSASVGAERRVLGGNFELESIEEAPAVDLACESEALSTAEPILLRFVSPLRLERPAGAVEKGATYLDRDCFPLAHFLDRLWRRLFRFAEDRWPEEEERRATMPPLPGTAEADPSGLLWIDLPHAGRKRTLGGALGMVECRGVPEEWLPALVLGRHLQGGSSVHFGFGRYVFGDLLGPLETPSRFLWQQVAERERLDRALGHVAEHSVAGGVDGVSPSRFLKERDERIPALLGDLRGGRMEASPLLGIPMRRENRRKIRPLAIPTVADRVVQRAALEILAPAVDTLFEDCSFAYRKGYSRAGAARAIQDAYRDGFRVVLDADISAFFDEVRWPRLFAMVDALFPGEPLNALIRGWVTAPVHFEGVRLVRRTGLPQGAAISPLLANLYLDELDDEVLGEEFRLVRYADDFVVLCRDLEAAERARGEVEEALDDLGLRLNEEKTSFRSLDDGMSYLGYLFCRSLVLEPVGDDEAEELGAEIPGDLEIPARSWLAEVPLDRVRAVLDQRGSARRGRVEAVPIGDRRRGRRALYVVSAQARLYLRSGTLVVDDGGEDRSSVPLRHLSHVVFLGRSRVTVPLLLSLDAHGVAAYFCRPTGELRARWEPHEPEWPLWLEQARCLADGGARLDLAREIVATKLRNQATILVRHHLEGAADAADRIRDLSRDAEEADSPESLRGFEGAGAKEYFTAYRGHLDAAWGFEGRRHRPPPDPVNALLSFVYTMLHHHVSTAVIAAGLNPRLGLFHEPRGAHHALASDLQEEFRFLAESTVLALIHRKEIDPEDFRHRPRATYPVLLKPEARKRVIRSFERRLLTEVRLGDGDPPRPWREIVDRQAWALRQWILDPQGERYQAVVAPG